MTVHCNDKLQKNVSKTMIVVNTIPLRGTTKEPLSCWLFQNIARN